MPQLSKKALVAFVLATLAGACLHFLHALFPNVLTAFFSPVNESLWEHVKILFWPYLVATLVLSQGEERPRLGARLLSLLLICSSMLAIGYLYHIVLGGEAPAFDLGLYVLLMAAGFLLPAAFQKPLEGRGQGILVGLTVLMAALIFLFTFLPPDLLLFVDLSGADTWSQIPC